MTVLEEQICEFAGLTGCDGQILPMRAPNGDFRYVCKGHADEIFQLVWR